MASEGVVLGFYLHNSKHYNYFAQPNDSTVELNQSVLLKKILDAERVYKIYLMDLEDHIKVITKCKLPKHLHSARRKYGTFYCFRNE